MVSVEVMGDTKGALEPAFVKQAAAAVLHHFKNDLGRTTITVAEFAAALEKILRGFGLNVIRPDEKKTEPPAAIADLRLLARESGSANELFFYPRLREQIRAQLQKSPRLVRFRGLRGCVKQLTGARRWSPRCEKLHGQILTYLRRCLSSESQDGQCLLVVE
jgi:hypothetical protein